ncbi:hypothetical protein [Actinocorallia libanotica]|uniref:Uncharacterized protein n=1 Tax=Actinocorallia libanotica TaxID=46162 RepID=A0ABN1Q3F9_9ACTN
MKIISPKGDEDEVEEYPGIHVGGLYTVLEIMAGPDYYCVRIWGDHEEDPGTLWAPEMFETVDQRVSSRWTVSMNAGHMRFAPAAWQRPGFWNDYFDREPAAVDSVRSEIALLLEEHRVG